MNTEIIKKDKSALPRQEVQAVVTFESTTPSRQELIKDLSAKLKTKADLIIVKTIYTSYGNKEAVVVAYVYDDENSMKSIEYPKMVEKNTLKKNEPKTEEKAEDGSQTAEKPEGEQ